MFDFLGETVSAPARCEFRAQLVTSQIQTYFQKDNTLARTEDFGSVSTTKRERDDVNFAPTDTLKMKDGLDWSALACRVGGNEPPLRMPKIGSHFLAGGAKSVTRGRWTSREERRRNGIRTGMIYYIWRRLGRSREGELIRPDKEEEL